MVGGSGFQPRFIRTIAVKNRSHNPKSTDTTLTSFFIDQTGRFSGQRLRSYETTPKWNVFLVIRLAASMIWIKQRTAEYRISNRRISKGGFALLILFL
jgi:hypothetical protein